jgi:DNA (cytosine-5)-methyltransferase 1
VDITKSINTISFFKGYGGIERGIELTGERIRSIASCEIEAYAISNLIAKMEEGALDPHPIWTNAKTFPGEQFLGKVDLFTGGFPCQPFSSAGSRNADSDPRHLWPACIRAIESFRPNRVFFENVEGLISAKLGGDEWSDPKGTPVLLHVCRELERRGYKTTWGVFSASEAGAPHQRKRVFILGQLADSKTMQCNGSEDNSEEFNGFQEIPELRDSSGEGGVQELAISDNEGLHGQLWDSLKESQGWEEERRHIATKSIWPARPGQWQFTFEQPRTKPKLGRTTDGPQNRIDRLRLLGNGVVPQTAAIAWTVLNERLQNER